MTKLEIIDQVPEFACLVAMELKKIMNPAEDLISQSKAFKEYGRSWVEKWTARKALTPVFHGNKKMYSRSELERILVKVKYTGQGS